MTTKHAAIYSRVSSKRQDTRSQEPDLSNWVMSQNEPVEWYQDKFTGRTMERPGWQKLWRASRRGTGLDDRGLAAGPAGANGSRPDQAVRRPAQRGVNLISLKDGFDLKTPAGRLMATFLAGAAEYDNELRTERVLAGQAVARANGKTWGGWARGRRRKVTAEQVAVIGQMRAGGQQDRGHCPSDGLSRPVGLSRPKAAGAQADL